MNGENSNTYQAWDLPVRLFHWINFFTVFLLIVIAGIMLFKSELGITGTDAKVGLKVLHVSFGYLLIINLLIRIVWMFTGSRFARWSAVFPTLKAIAQLKPYRDSLRQGEPQQFLGHNPPGRLAISLIYLLLLTLAVTGLVRAGTDIYYPPFGTSVQAYLADSGVEPGALIPYDSTGENSEKKASLKELKNPSAPFINTVPISSCL